MLIVTITSIQINLQCLIVKSLLNEGETVYLVDSIPIPVCQITREKSRKRIETLFSQLCDQQMLNIYGWLMHMSFLSRSS